MVLTAAGAWTARSARAALRRNRAPGTRIRVGPPTFLFLAVAMRVQSPLASLAFLLVLVAWAFSLRPRQRRRTTNWVDALPAAGVLVTVALVYSQNPSAPGARDAALALAFAALVMVRSLRVFSPTDSMTQLAEGLGAYLLASVAFHLAGIHSPGEGTRISGLDNASGLFSSRVLFPFALSYVTGPAAAAGFLACLPGLSLAMGGRHRVFHHLAAGAAVFVVLAGGYRSPLVFGTLAAVGVLLRPRFFMRLAPAFAVIALTMPLWYSALAGPVTSAISSVERLGYGLEERQGSTSALSNRDIVWRRSLDTIAAESVWAKVLGNGADGHVTSGAAAGYGEALGGLLTRTATQNVPPHSTILQVLFDAGFVGATAVTAALWLSLRRLRDLVRAGHLVALSAVGALVAFAAVGATEVVLAPTPSFQEPFLYLGLLTLVLSQVPGPVPECRVRSSSPALGDSRVHHAVVVPQTRGMHRLLSDA